MVDESEGSLAVVAGEGREPPEDGGARARVRRGGLGEGGVVEGDVSSERVQQLLRFHSHLPRSIAPQETMDELFPFHAEEEEKLKLKLKLKQRPFCL